MKKIYVFLSSVLLSGTAFAQVPDNAGMETWRTGTAGLPPVSIAAPTQWYGYDSLILAYSFVIGGTSFNRQLFEETSVVNAGSGAAKLLTAMEGDLGFTPGFLSNAKASVDLAAVLGGADPLEAIEFSGGTSVTVQPSTVSAWVSYFPGIDPTTGLMGGADEAILSGQALATIGGVDSIVGYGAVTITPSSAYTQVTATFTYTTTLYPVHTLRILFASSADISSALDSSTLYVDDVSYTGVPNPPAPPPPPPPVPPAGISQANAQHAVSLFPNPATGTLNIHSPIDSRLKCVLATVSGQVVATRELSGDDKLEISSFAAGIYLYSITDSSGSVVQRGNVCIY